MMVVLVLRCCFSRVGGSAGLLASALACSLLAGCLASGCWVWVLGAGCGVRVRGVGDGRLFAYIVGKLGKLVATIQNSGNEVVATKKLG